MRDRLLSTVRKGLDSLEHRQDSKDTEFAALVSGHVDAMADRAKLCRYCLVLGLINALMWFVVIAFPVQVMDAWTKVNDVNEKIAFTSIAIPFGIGLWLTYALLRLKFPNVEDKDLGSEVFGSVAYHANSNRRFRVWVAAAAGGVVNALGLVVLELARGTG